MHWCSYNAGMSSTKFLVDVHYLAYPEGVHEVADQWIVENGPGEEFSTCRTRWHAVCDSLPAAIKTANREIDRPDVVEIRILQWRGPARLALGDLAVRQSSEAATVLAHAWQRDFDERLVSRYGPGGVLWEVNMGPWNEWCAKGIHTLQQVTFHAHYGMPADTQWDQFLHLSPQDADPEFERTCLDFVAL